MKKRLLSMLLVLCMVCSLLPAMALTANAAQGDLPTTMYVAPSDTNGISAQINLWRTGSSGGGQWGGGGGGSTTYELYLPGTVDTSKVFFSWADGLQATVDGRTYASGACPVPAAGETKTYTFTKGSSNASFTVKTWQGSPNVKPIFIEIDESKGTISAMDNDRDHETSCSGIVFIDGVQYTLSKIKGRGNYTWSQARDKKAYNLTIDKSVSILGIDTPPTKKWSILAEIADHSLLCNRSGFALAHQLDVGQDTTSADVWMNGEYQGCYTVTPKYDSYVTKDGFLIENDNYKESLTVAEGGDPQFALEGLDAPGNNNQWGGGGSDYNLITVKGIGDNLLAAAGDDTEKAAASIKAWLQDAWDAIRSSNGYNSKGKYYTDYIDIESFAKMYLMHEYVKSYDVCAGSILFHRDGNTDADKLIAGPIWDLDNAMGSTQSNGSLGSVGDRRSGRGAFIPQINEYKTSIYKTISRHEDFMEEVYRQYNLNRAAFDTLASSVQAMADGIEASAMMNHNKVESVGYNNHSYSRDTTLEQGTEYEQKMQSTSNDKTSWPSCVNNLEEYVKARSLWFANTYTREDVGFVATMNAGQGSTVTTYDTQDDAVNDANGTVGEKYVYARDSATGDIIKDGNGQINFRVAVTAPYQLDAVTVEPAENFKNLKGPEDTGVPGLYRVTKVTGPLAIKVVTSEIVCEHEFDENGVCPKCGLSACKVTFDCDAHCSVTSFDTQDLSAEGRNVGFALGRDSKTGAVVATEGQVNFIVNVDEGYAVNTLVAEPAGGYNNLKDPADASVPNSYRLTKVAKSFVLHVTTKKISDPITDYFADGDYNESAWTVLNEDKAAYSVTKGAGIVMPTQEADIYSTGGAWKNAFVTPTEGDWKAVTKVVYPKTPTANYQQGMMLVWQDEDNYIRLNCQQSSLRIEPGKETDGSFSSTGFQSPNAQAAADGSVTLYFMIEKAGTTYTLSYSQDGLNFTNLGSTTADYASPKIGLFASQNSSNEPIDVNFEYLMILGHDGVEEYTPARMLTWAAQNVADYLFADLPAEVNGDLDLTKIPHGYDVTVTCDHPEILDENGKFTKPLTDTQIKVSLTVTEGDAAGTTDSVKLLAKGESEAVVPIATFNCDKHCSVTAYDTSDLSGEGHPNAAYALSRDKATGNAVAEGGQIWFVVVPDEGYEVKSVTAEPTTSYNKLKDPADETVPNSYNCTKVTADFTITIKTKKIPGGPSNNADIDFTTHDDEDKYEVVNKDTAEVVEDTGLTLTATADAFEPVQSGGGGWPGGGGQTTASTPKDLIKVPVEGDWTAILELDFNQNNVQFSQNEYFAFLAMAGDDYQNMAGFRTNNSVSQDFLRKNGTITTTISGGGGMGGGGQTGFNSTRTYWLQLEKEDTTYIASRSTDGEEFTELFRLEDTDIDAEYIVIDAYKTSSNQWGGNSSYRYTLKSLTFEGGAPIVLDKTALNAAIAAAKAIDRDKYTNKTLAALDEALAAAEAAAESAKRQAVIDEAAAALNAAIAGLAEKPAPGSLPNIDFTSTADSDKYEIAGQSQSAVEEGVGLALVATSGGIEPAKQNVAEADNDVVKVPVSGDWTATLEVDFDANGARNGYYQFFAFVASQGGDNKNLVGIRGGDGSMQDFIRKDGAITEETQTSTPGFANAGKYFLRIEKDGDKYTCYRSADGEEFTEMFSYADTGIEADQILIDAYTGMTEGYKFTLKSLTFEGGEPAHTHSYTAVVTPPTCTEGGYTTYTCACGDSYVADETPALGHNFVDGVCTRCGERETVADITATFVCDEGVSIDVYKTQAADSEVFHNAATANPRDSASGEIDNSGSGQINFVVVVADGYTLDSVSAEPAANYKNLKLPDETLVNNGYRITKVTGDLTVTVKATKNEPGTCEHDYKAEVTPATCTAQGFTTYTCSKCGDSYVGDYTAKIPHNYVNDACTVCGEKLLTVTIACDPGASVTVYETQKITGPSAENAVSANPRDGDSGLIDCSGDGQVNFVVKLAEGYKLDSVTAEPAASYKNLKGPEDTQIENGYRITKVKGDFTITVKASKTDTGECEHTFTSVRVEPTCTEPAKMVYTCSKCGYSYEEDLYTAPVIETEISVPSTYTATRSDYTYGAKETITYYSTTAGRNKNANVQLPANYDPNKKYPVMYLLHGVMGSENDMVGNGTIIQNLVADGLAEEMIIVCPNMWSSNTSASPGGINQTTMEGYDRFHLDLVNDLMPYMAEHYSVAEGKENTAVCGFSQGGRETLLIGLYHPDKIGYLCAISSAPGIVAATDNYMAHPGVFKEEEVRYDGETPYLIMMTSGDNDNVVGKNPQEYHRIYTENGIAHTWWEIPGADHGGATNSGVYNFAKYAFKVKGEGAPLGHDWETEVTAPTCTAEGYTTYTCKRCGVVETRDVKAKAPHNYVDGVCTVCGEKLLNVTIDADEGVTVTVYETKDPKGGRIVGASSTNPRDGDTGLIDCSGEGQVNFSYKVKAGYVFDSLTVTPKEGYKNLKGPEDTGIKNGYRITKVTGDLTITIRTTFTGEAPENADIDFTDLADVDKYEIVNQDTAECISGTGVKLTTTADAFEPIGGGFGGDATASEPKDLIKIPVSGDWTATLKFEYDQNNVTFAFNSYFAFLAMAGDDYQNMAGIRATNSTAQDFLRKDGTITTTISGGGMWGGDQGPQTGFPSNGTYWYRLEKDGETYIASRSTDGETFEEMFKLEDTGIDAEYIVIDAYKTSTFSFGGDANWLFTLKTLEFEGGEVGPVINKAALQAAIAAAEAIDTSKYTDESVAAMQSALNAAKAALSADTQAAVDAAASALTAAVAALVAKPVEEPVNYDALNAAIADAEKIDVSKYTDASVAAFQTALNAAKAARTAGKQADVDAAKAALDAAVAGLVKKPVEPIGGLEDIDFTDPADAGKYELAGQSESAVVEGEGLALVASQGGVEPAKQSIAEADIDVVKIPVGGDWTATLETVFDANGAANGYYQFFGFYASEGGDNQNMVGIRGGDGAMQDFIRKDGAISEELQTSAPGFDTTGKTYFLRIAKEGDTYTCYRSDDGEAFTEMFAFEGTGIDADEIIIDAYTGMTAGYKFTLKSLKFEGGEPGCEHDYVPVVTAPTCTEKGYTTYTCSKCGKSYTGDEVAALGHDWGEGVVTKQPTETEKGERTYTCSRCGEKRTEEIPELTHVHDYKAVVTAPTCTEGGYTTYTCSGCGDTYRANETAALGHSFGQWTTTKAATCTAAGEQTRTCSRCGEKETKAIDALGHDYKAVVTAPTCTAKGYTTYTCSRCGDSYTGNEVAATGHSFGEWTVTKAASCTEKGEETRTCAKCGEKETRELAATGHSFGEWAVTKAATCTAAGEETRTCAKCGAKETRAIDALGHDYVNGVCSRCGEADPNYVPPVDYTALNAAIEAAEKLDLSKYTDASVAAFNKALADAKAAQTADTQAAVDKAKEDLEKTVNALAPKPPVDPFRFDDVKDSSQYYFEPVYWAYNYQPQITNGTSKNLFSPEKGCTRAQVVTFLWRYAGMPEPNATTCNFKDVDKEQYYYKAVLWAVEKKITNGTSETTFDPEKTCTRAQIVTFLWRYAGEPKPATTKNDFKDVKDSAYYYNAVLWAAENDITNGTSATTFDPEKTCTRAQIVTFLYRYNAKKTAG